MAHVVALMLKPVGKAGLALQEVTLPVKEGAFVVMVAFCVQVYGLPEQTNEDGGVALTVILIVVVVLSEELLAVIV